MTAIRQAPDIDTLVGRVSALLDIPITSDSIPSQAQVIQWLNDGLLVLTKLLPEERMAWAQHEDEHDDVGSELHLEGSDIIRIVSVAKYGFTCTEKTIDYLRSMKARMPYMATVMSPYYARFGRSGKVRLKFLPESKGKITLSYIRMPTAYTSSWTPDDYSAPAELEELIVDYAVVRGKIQDEEPQQVQLLWQAWFQSAGLEPNLDMTGVEE